jgi:hypothetical protein
MANNSIEIYQGNSKLIVCDVSGLIDLIGYTPTLMVKKDSFDVTSLLSKTGTTSGLEISFDLSYTDTSINTGNYLYDITIESSTHKYTCAQDEFNVIDSVRY